MTKGEIRRFPDGDALAQATAAYFVETASQSIRERGRFTVALSGGSTPKALHHVLVRDFAEQVDWSKVAVFWGDERSVPPDHEDSNYRMAKETLLDHVPILESHIYRIQGELAPHQASAAYERVLANYFGNVVGEGFPVFDLIFLGMGDDGHTASLFPGTEALSESQRWVVANHVPKLDTWRITFTAPLINAAKRIVFLVAGEKKADALREVINGPYLPEQFPSQLIEPASGTLIWMVDEAASALM